MHNPTLLHQNVTIVSAPTTTVATVPRSAPREAHDRLRVSWWLDSGLFVTCLLLMAPHLTGLTVHEWLGLALATPVLLHLLLSWRWIAAAAARLLRPRSARDTVNFALNLALFVAITVVIVSGLVISRVVAPSIGIVTIDDRAWRLLHNRCANWMWWITSAHLAMNWRWIANTTRRITARRRTA